MKATAGCFALCLLLCSSPALAAPTFAPRVDYPTGSAPQTSAIADLNADGVPDVAWVNYGLASNTVSVALGIGGGSFGPRTDYGVGSNPATIAIGDLNHDARPDLVVCNWSGASVSVLLGTGGGSFGAATGYSTGGRPICGVLADLNSDGNLDLVVADWSGNTLKRLLGTGAGGFGAATSYSAGSHPYGLALADLNGDGRLDAVTSNRSTSNVSVLLGTVGGGFGAPASVTVGSDPIWVALADVNGDGKRDLAAANFAANTVSVLPGNGSGGFGAKTDYATGTQPISVEVADLDQDSKLDLAVSGYAANVLSVLSGDGAGGFGPKVDFATAPGPVHFTVADLNADGRLDLVIPCAANDSLAVLLNAAPTTGVPSAANSTCPTLVSADPNSTCCFDVVVRDLLNNPIPGSSVVVTFNGCPTTFCPTQPAGVLVNQPAQTARVFTDPTGTAHFCVCVSNLLSGCTATVHADGTLLCNALPVASCPSDSTCAPGQWHLVATSGPSPRYDMALASDYDYEKILLFGGTNGSGVLGDTWRWDGYTWNALSPATSPSGRARHAMTYDRVRKRVVLFGGFDGSTALGDTWEWNGMTWTLAATTGPTARYNHEMVYDENRGRVVLFGGFDGGFLGDTWEWDGTTWTQVSTSTSPSARTDFGLAFDQESGLTMLYGGADASGTRSDQWLYDGTDWFQLPPLSAGPGARSGHALAFGNEGGSVVLYGGAGPGANANTERWLEGKWVDIPYGVGTRLGHAMAYDHFNDHMLLFGGYESPANPTPSGMTWEWCSPCTEVSALLDSLGEVIVPAGADPAVYNNPESDDAAGSVSSLYPTSDPSTDAWLDDLPCNPSFGGEPDSLDIDDPWSEAVDSLGFQTLTEEDLADSLASWKTTVSEEVQNMPPPISDSLAAAGNYTPLPLQRCPPADLPLAFGGRDIVFVHGYRTTPIQQKMFGTNDSASVDWVRTNGAPGWVANPWFYDGLTYYWGRGAVKYWQPHIKKFLTDKGYKNRYLIVAWSSNQPLWIAVHAVLTQISDAMIYDKGVVDPSNGALGSHNFGSRGLVFVSHSTGGPVTDVTLSAAAHLPSLHAGFIADRAKAHIAIASVFSGSHEATALLGVTKHSTIANVFQAAHDMCVFTNQLVGSSASTCDGWPQPLAPWSGVSVDLDPPTMQSRWGPFMRMTPTRTVTLTGGHPSFYNFAKHRLLPGQDDGVTTMNSQTANPKDVGLWPSGYLRIGPHSTAARAVVDVGLTPRRKKGYRRDQIRDARKADAPAGWPEHWDRFLTRVASGSTDRISPTGMLQPWHLPVFDPLFTGPLDPNGRYPAHYSFIQGAADHFSMTPNWADLYDDPTDDGSIALNDQWNNSRYTPTKGAANDEEALVIDDAAIYDSYGPAWDTAPLLNKNDPVVVAGLSQVEVKGSKCIRKHPKRKCRLSLRKRLYHRLAGWETKMECDYAYDYLLRDRPICTVGVDGGTRPLLANVRTGPNPFRGVVNIDFTVGRRARVQLDIYDSQGRRVRNLLRQTLEAGDRSLAWDSRSDAGRLLPTGLYLWRLRIDGSEKASGKVLLLH